MKPVIFMKSKIPVLEYLLAGTAPGKMAKWGFRFRTSEGDVLIESALNFRSQADAERAFVSVIKSIATNKYAVECPTASRARSKSSRRPNGSLQRKGRGRVDFAGSNSIACPTPRWP
jgi:hypothetical protein